MGPGPCNPYPEATLALARPMLGHLDPEFIDLLDETCDRLRTVWATGNPVTLPVSGTGSAGMEAAFVNSVGPGDVVVVGVNGLFGERMCDVAGRCGAEVVRVDAPWGQPLDPEAVLAAHPAPKVIAVVHAETSTGVRNDVAPPRRRQGRRPSAGRLRHVARWYSGRCRRLGDRHRLQRDPEVPGGVAGAGAADLRAAGVGPAGAAAPELVPRPGDDRRLHGRRGRASTTTPRPSP